MSAAAIIQEPVANANAAVAKPAPAPSMTAMYTKSITDRIENLSSQLEGQSLNALTQGFFFAAALSWMDVSRSVIGKFIKGNRNGVFPLTLTALATTVLSILVFMIISTISPRVTKPTAPVYAVVGGR
jgi:hypothetical protein